MPKELLHSAHKIEKAIPKEEQILVIGNDSPLIYLYYIHRKGVTIHQSISDEDLERFRNLGFWYVVSRVPLNAVPAFKDINL